MKRIVSQLALVQNLCLTILVRLLQLKRLRTFILSKESLLLIYAIQELAHLIIFSDMERFMRSYFCKIYEVLSRKITHLAEGILGR